MGKRSEFIDGKKIYTSKAGHRFAIAPIPRPPAGDVVFFTQLEFDWIQRQNLSPEEFTLLWALKKDDFRYHCIPEEEIDEPKRLAAKYGPACLAALKGAGSEKKTEPVAVAGAPEPIGAAIGALLDSVPAQDLDAVLHGRKPWPRIGLGDENHAADAPGAPSQDAGGAQEKPPGQE